MECCPSSAAGGTVHVGIAVGQKVVQYVNLVLHLFGIVAIPLYNGMDRSLQHGVVTIWIQILLGLEQCDDMLYT